MATFNIDIDKAKIKIDELIFGKNIGIADITDYGISCACPKTSKERKSPAPRLTDKEKETIATLWYYDGLICAEIARRMNLPWNRVGYCLFPERYRQYQMRYLRRKAKKLDDLENSIGIVEYDDSDVVNINIKSLKCDIRKITA